MASTSSNRPVVNTSILIRKAAVKTVASMSNGFTVGGIPASTGTLVISCLNVVARQIKVRHNAVAMAVGSSAGILSRIIMATRKLGHGRGTLNCSARGITNRSLAVSQRASLNGTVTNGISKTHFVNNTDSNFSTNAVVLHNTNSVPSSSRSSGPTGRPVCIMSNTVAGGGSVGVSSIRDVGMLGNPTTATLCNSHNNTNTVVVAAGTKRDRGKLLRMDRALRTRACCGRFGVRGLCNNKKCKNARGNGETRSVCSLCDNSVPNLRNTCICSCGRSAS